MQGRHSLRKDLTPVNDNIYQTKRLREHLRRLAEKHNIVPMVIEGDNNQANQPRVVSGERQLVMKE